MSGYDDRIQRLEEEQYFQEKLLKDLEALIIEHEAQLKKISQNIEKLTQQFLIIQELLSVKFENVPPPHYLPKL